jgi:osmoprotectant transport system permease protein
MEFLADVVAWFADPAQWRGPRGIPVRTVEHLKISGGATLIAGAMALPPAVWLAHHRRAEFFSNAIVNVGRAVPSFGVVVIAAVIAIRSGISATFWPIVVALVALALPPIFTNTYTAVRTADPATVQAARGMGLTEWQIMRSIELPLGAPVLLAGVRIAFVQVIATATLGAIVGPGGGLGRYIIDGFARGPGGRAEVFAGALLVAALTVLSEYLFTLGERGVLPGGVRRLVRTADVAETAQAGGG